MRVVSGTLRSRKIKDVNSEATRPTTDRNKEALFNILGQYFDGGSMLDLYAGSGALGIEAISRGMDHVDFVDQQPLAYRTIQENLSDLGIQKHGTVHKMDVLAFLQMEHQPVSLIIADPPYALNPYNEILKSIVSGHLLDDNGIIVFEADKNTVLPDSLGELERFREKIFGNTKFGFYHWRKEA